MLMRAWTLLKDTVSAFVDDGALSRGASIAFFTTTSLAPVLLIVIAVAGLVFGREASQQAVLSQLGGLMGQQAADTLKATLASASNETSGRGQSSDAVNAGKAAAAKKSLRFTLDGTIS